MLISASGATLDNGTQKGNQFPQGWQRFTRQGLANHLNVRYAQCPRKLGRSCCLKTASMLVSASSYKSTWPD
jgi:hypothetical protein